MCLDVADYSWMEDTVAQAHRELGGDALSVHVHVTGDNEQSAESPVEDKTDEKEAIGGVAFLDGRPTLTDLVNDTCAAATGRVAIVGASFLGFHN